MVQAKSNSNISPENKNIRYRFTKAEYTAFLRARNFDENKIEEIVERAYK